MSDPVALRNALVASLFELSNAAQNTAAATINLVNHYKTGDSQTADALSTLAETLVGVTGKPLEDALKKSADSAPAANGAIASDAAKVEKKKKKERDPNAPKKPLTMYFAFSFDAREKIKEERKRKGLEPLSAVAMNDIIKERWANITADDKDTWQQKYQTDYAKYQKLKEAYDQAKKDGLDPVSAAKKVEEKEEEEKKSKKRKDGDKSDKKSKKLKKEKSDK